MPGARAPLRVEEDLPYLATRPPPLVMRDCRSPRRVPSSPPALTPRDLKRLNIIAERKKPSPPLPSEGGSVHSERYRGDLSAQAMSSKGVALVTGAAQGIGRGVALRLAEDGFDVAINDIPDKSAELDTLVEEIQQKQRKSSKHLADVSQEESVKEMVVEVVKAHGGLDVMVANAGIAGPWTSLVGGTPPLHRSISAEQWDKVMAVNARGTFLCYKHAGLQMIAQGRGGRIIGASSYAGKMAVALQSVYSTSKFAIRGLTQAAALEFGPHGITVNAVAPGMIVTPMLTEALKEAAEQAETLLEKMKSASPLNKLGTPEDIAGLVSFLASKESQFITGSHV
ncbi:NAD-binding protein [Mycena sanguinolenta]|uniref:NAD-binding protein n=1 Tax=Mycena sanguinolenta TaxID=230812 RepID=A0A8H6WRW6_9AGAR|nr:NAD-binding protein [Mycena sanguinolenta]